MSEPVSGAASSEPAASTTSKPAGSATAANAQPKPKPNPALAAMGLPNFRLRLPSRNWMIFLSIVGSWTGAVVYDRMQRKKVQKKWCTLVEHIAQEALPARHMMRKVTIVLAAPPGDGLRTAREHFVEYVKPILVAGAMDWDVIEGRKEGDVRAGVAERIRRLRRKHGEHADTSIELDQATAYENVRARTGIQESPAVRGDIVIGRHTWKEYVRGVHEGWLGSIDPPKEPEIAKPVVPVVEEVIPQATPVNAAPTSSAEVPSSDLPLFEEPSQAPDDASPTTSIEPPKEEKKDEPEKPKKPQVAPPYNTTGSYASSPLPPSIPSELQPSTPVPYPHILGFLRTPIRIYRFLNRRHLADDVGRQTAAAVLAAYRPWTEDTGAVESDDSPGNSNGTRRHWEQEDVLVEEETYWHKSARERKDDDGERVWMDKIVVDPRIGQRMRRFEVEPWEEERARAIWKGSKGLPVGGIKMSSAKTSSNCEASVR